MSSNDASARGAATNASGRRALVGEVLLELALHAQRLRTLDLEPAAGEVVGLVQREVDRGHQEKQPRREHRPAISAQAAAQAHHELLDSELPAFCPALRSVSVQQREVGCRAPQQRPNRALTLSRATRRSVLRGLRASCRLPAGLLARLASPAAGMAVCALAVSAGLSGRGTCCRRSRGVCEAVESVRKPLGVVHEYDHQGAASQSLRGVRCLGSRWRGGGRTLAGSVGDRRAGSLRGQRGRQDHRLGGHLDGQLPRLAPADQPGVDDDLPAAGRSGIAGRAEELLRCQSRRWPRTCSSCSSRW